MKKAIVAIFDGFEEIEAVATADVLRRAGVAVVLAAYGKSKTVVGRSGIKTIADELFAEAVLRGDFDAFVLSGGPGVKKLADEKPLLDALGKFGCEGKLLAAICAAPLVFHNAGVLCEKHFTAHPSVWSVLKAVDKAAEVVVDGNIVTSQGAGTALAFALALAEILAGVEAARETAKSICYNI